VNRYFAGIELDATTRAACTEVAQRLRAAGFQAAYQSTEKLHITLAFLGNVEDSRYAEIEEALHKAAASIPRFDLTLDRIGAFPHERNPRVVFVGAREQGVGYRLAATAVRARYEALGFTFTDDAIAHVTLARVKGGAPRPPPSIELVSIPLRVTEVAVFESIFDAAGGTTRYEVRARATLQTSRDS